MDSTLPFPVVRSRGSGVINSNVTTHSITMPPDIEVGDMILVFFSVDQDPTITFSSNEWRKVCQLVAGSLATGCVLYKIATGSDSLSITTSSAQYSSYLTWAISGGGSVTACASWFSPTEFAAAHSNEWKSNVLNIVAFSRGGTGSASAAPSGFSNLRNAQTNNNANGASCWAAERNWTPTYYDEVPDDEDGTGPFTASSGNGNSFNIIVFPDNPSKVRSPRIISTETTVDRTLATTKQVRLPQHHLRGDTLLAFVSFSPNNSTGADPVPSLSSSSEGWEILEEDNIVTEAEDDYGIKGMILSKQVIGPMTEAPLIFSMGAQCYMSAVVHCIRGASIIRSGMRQNNANANITFSTSPYPGLSYDEVTLNIGYYMTRAINTTNYNVDNPSFAVDAEQAPTTMTCQAVSADYRYFQGYSASSVNKTPARTISGSVQVQGKYSISPYPKADAFVSASVPPEGLTFDFSTLEPNVIAYERVIIAQYAVTTSDGRNPTLTIPGYTTIHEQFSPGTYSTKQIVAYKVMGTTPDTSITVSGTGHQDDTGLLTLMSFFDVDLENPIDGLGFAVGAGTNRPVGFTVESQLQGSTFIRAASGSNAPGSFSHPNNTSYNDRVRATNTTGSSSTGSTLSYRVALDHTSTGNNWTSGTVNADNTWALIQFALRPAHTPTNTYNYSDDQSRVKYWDGTEWVRSEGVSNNNSLKYRTGGKWIKKPYHVFDGTKWV